MTPRINIEIVDDKLIVLAKSIGYFEIALPQKGEKCDCEQAFDIVTFYVDGQAQYTWQECNHCGRNTYQDFQAIGA